MKDQQFLFEMSESKTKRFSDISKLMGVDFSYSSKYRQRLIEIGIIKSVAYGKLGFDVPYSSDFITVTREYARHHLQDD
jgi:hypothetical protein